eukprot:396806-Pleurochrysis_carterae.AAC.1
MRRATARRDEATIDGAGHILGLEETAGVAGMAGMVATGEFAGLREVSGSEFGERASGVEEESSWVCVAEERGAAQGPSRRQAEQALTRGD